MIFNNYNNGTIKGKEIMSELFGEMFGKNLRQLRIEKNLTQKEVAQRLTVSESTYANWEQGRREPSLLDLVSISILFDVDINTLFGYDEKQTKAKQLSDIFKNDMPSDIRQILKEIEIKKALK